MDMLNSIKDPLTDNNINYLVDSYLNNDELIRDVDIYNGRYNSLKDDSYKNDPILRSRLYELYKDSFDEWKRSVLQTPVSRIDITKKSDFLELRKILSRIEPVYGLGDIRELCNKYPLIEKYYHSNGRIYNEVTVASYNKHDAESMKREHVLYLNIPITSIPGFLKHYKSECNEKNIPYDTVLNVDEKCDGQVIIYSNNKNLDNNIEILNKIHDEYPVLFDDKLKPPVFAGVINDFLGYGKLNNRKNYLSDRWYVFKLALYDELKKIYYENENEFYDVVRDSIMENVVNLAFHTGTDANREVTENYVRESFSDNYETYLENIFDGDDTTKGMFKISNGTRTFTINEADFERALKNKSKDLLVYDPDFINNIRERMRIIGKEKGIPESNFSFDTDFVNRSRMIEDSGSVTTFLKPDGVKAITGGVTSTRKHEASKEKPIIDNSINTSDNDNKDDDILLYTELDENNSDYLLLHYLSGKVERMFFIEPDFEKTR